VDGAQARQTWKWALDRLVARPRSAQRFDLLDAEGKYVGSALSMAHAERFAADIGATVELADPGGVSRRWPF
jgi:hypothetical protein